jgi:hypothetical protein
LTAALATLATAVLLVSILVVTGGVFVYTLDDPYIHLALSENLARGHYGINTGERAAPSSSIIFPFLLTLGTGTALHGFVPLVINVAATGLTLWSITAIAAESGLIKSRPATWAVAALIFVLGFCLNLFGIIFTGLEHSLHIALSLLVLAGLIRMSEGEKPPAWLVPAIVLLPLIRFEGLALAGTASAALVLFGYRCRGALAVASVAILLLAYVAAMKSMGLPPLPSSVMVKSGVASAAQSGGSFQAMWEAVWQFRSVVRTVYEAQLLLGLVLLCVFAPLISAWVKRRPLHPGEMIVSGAVAMAGLGHLAAGGFGWFGRYEVYIMTLVTVALLYLYRLMLLRLWWSLGPHSSRSRRLGAASVLVGSAIALALVTHPYILVTLRSPAASRTIFRQQMQMGEFAKKFYNAPVAVNDLGLVAWRNPNFVLDLWGLGSETARLADRSNNAWLGELTAKHHVGVAMIYRPWFTTLPRDWEPIAELHLGAPLMAAAYHTVTFYRTPQGDPAKVEEALSRFRASLPEGVTLKDLDACREEAVAIASVRARLREGAARGARPIPCPVLVTLERPTVINKLEVQASNDDTYILSFLRDGKEVGTKTVRPVTQSALRTRVIDVEGIEADTIRVEGIGGDSRYLLARMTVNPE